MRRLIPITLCFPILLMGGSHSPSGPQSSSPQLPFQISIVDQRTGEGVPNVQLIAHNRIVCYTRSDGSVMWTESSLMDRDVYFSVKSETHRLPDDGAMLHMTRGGRAELKVLN